DGLEFLEPPRAKAESTNTEAIVAEESGADHTHLTKEGGAIIGPIVAEELARVVPELAPYIHGSTQFGADVPDANCVVARDGTGNFTNIQTAIDAAPANLTHPYIIFLKPDTYIGHVHVPEDKPFIALRGLTATNTIITDDKNVFAADKEGHKLGTPGSST